MLTLAISLCAGAAMADHIGVYTTALGADSDCQLDSYVAFAPFNVYLVHKFNEGGSTASQMKVNDLSGLQPLSQSTPYLALGTWNTDYSLAYGGCVIGDHTLATLQFLAFAPSGPVNCAGGLQVVAAPTSPIPGAIAYVECDFETVTPMSGGNFYFGTGTCPNGCGEVATAETTWGGIKALYR
jgi:hypothetical protein